MHPNKFIISIMLIVVVPFLSLYLALFASVDVTFLLLVFGTVVVNIYIIVVCDIEQSSKCKRKAGV